MKNIYLTLRRGFAWSFFGNALSGVTGLSVILFLAYSLGTEKMGIFSILSILMGLSDNLAQFGVSQSIIARQENTKNELSSIFWSNVAIGTVVFFFINLLSFPVSWFYEDKDLRSYMFLMSFVFLLQSPCLVFRAILQKELQYRILEKINITTVIISALSIIALVLCGFGLIGYIFGTLFSVAFSTVFYLLVFLKKRYWFPTLHFQLEEVKKHYRFGFYVTAKSFVNFFGRRIDELIIGKMLGTETLGIYFLGKNTIEKFSQLIYNSVSKITFPLFSKLKTNKKKLGETYMNLSMIFISPSAFLFVSLILVTPYVFPYFFDEKWSSAVFVIQIFCIVSILKIIDNGFSPPILYIFQKRDFCFY
jgi:lipopolysaccharide exporter